jgi:glutamate synthase domain-containing protein 2
MLCATRCRYSSVRRFRPAAFSSLTSPPGGGGDKQVTVKHERKKQSTPSGKIDAALSVPDLIEHWGPESFKKVGAFMSLGALTATFGLGICQESLLIDTFVAAYWWKGYSDMNQKSHSILRNFPVLGNFRFVMEMIRPEIRQYLVESDQDGRPYDRDHRSVVYQRAKAVTDTIPFGTRRDVYAPGYEWANHSIFPSVIDFAAAGRVTIGGKDCKQPYASSLLNISAMSYGALSDNAILALSSSAKLGQYSHNTGEGGISKFHRDGGGDLVWNVGTGYFGCRNDDGTFNPTMFVANATLPNVKMIEIKLSQGAKPGHGGLLPGAKVTKLIADARGVSEGVDCHSPPRHSAFSDAAGLVDFIKHLRNLSGGKPIGFKFCVGRPEEFCSIVNAMVKADTYPDFITVDGSEGGTGAAPPEFSNSIGTPLVEGLSFVNQILLAAGIRHHIKIIASGKVTTGFSIVRNLALGADVCNSARAMLFALGCVQALKCNTNRCPTGITTQDPELMKGLDVNSKTYRVMQYHAETVKSAIDICQAIGIEHPSELRPHHINKRISMKETVLYDDLFPRPIKGSLFTEKGPIDHKGNQMNHLQAAWDRALRKSAYS